MAAKKSRKPRPKLAAAPEEVVEREGRKSKKRASKHDAHAGDIEPQNRLEAGPRKERPKGLPGPRLTNHKVRSVWFQARAAWPVREARVDALVAGRRAAAALPVSTQHETRWGLIGPLNIGGRVTSLACDPNKPDRIWAGSAGGGVWHSEDAGQSWTAQWHTEDVLNVGSLAIDPKNPDILYCGTGEANLSADSYGGLGIYRTADGGKTWTLWAPVNSTRIPRRIGAISIDPFDSSRLMLGGIGFREVSSGGSDLGGLYSSSDAGLTWTRQTAFTSGNYWCHAVLFHPTQRGTVYVAITAQGMQSGIYRSTNGGSTWTHLVDGLPSPDHIGRVSLALCASKPERMYANASQELSEHADQVLGVFRSDDGGSSWRKISHHQFTHEAQMSYGNTIVVDATNPNLVLCGGVDLHRTSDGGKTWKKVTFWDARKGDKDYAHADHHCLLMPAKANGRVYDANDGGLDVSDDKGLHWMNRSVGLGCTMFYDVDVAQTDARAFGGGAQDNGTVVTYTGRDNDFYEILGGDGGWMVYDPTDPSRVFASYYNLNIFRFAKRKYKDVSPPAEDDERSAVWMAYITLDPLDTHVVYTGSHRLWRSMNDGDKWDAITPVLDGSAISCIEVADADPTRLYVGTEDGGIFRSLDRGKTWSANIAGPLLPGHTITRLITSPNDANRVYATMANFGHAHVFRSDNGGVTWSDIDRGRLPDVPHYALAIPLTAPDTLFVGNDVGVFVSYDAGHTWSNLSGNLPHAMIVDLVYHEKSKTLMAATYGRSLWRLPL
jgi:photosystem II stability/assembly factor-like uncharacterized protein